LEEERWVSIPSSGERRLRRIRRDHGKFVSRGSQSPQAGNGVFDVLTEGYEACMWVCLNPLKRGTASSTRPHGEKHHGGNRSQSPQAGNGVFDIGVIMFLSVPTAVSIPSSGERRLRHRHEELREKGCEESQSPQAGNGVFDRSRPSPSSGPEGRVSIPSSGERRLRPSPRGGQLTGWMTRSQSPQAGNGVFDFRPRTGIPSRS